MSEKTQTTDLGSEVYSGLSGIGIFKANIIIIIAILAACVLVVVGIYVAWNDDENNYTRLDGTVIASNCKTTTTYSDRGQPSNTYNCYIDATYSIDNIEYTKTVNVNSSTSYVAKDKIQLMVLNSDHSIVRVAKLSGKSIGSILCCMALVFFCIAYLNYYASHKYKLFSAAQGANTVVGLFR